MVYVEVTFLDGLIVLSAEWRLVWSAPARLPRPPLNTVAFAVLASHTSVCLRALTIFVFPDKMVVKHGTYSTGGPGACRVPVTPVPVEYWWPRCL